MEAEEDTAASNVAWSYSDEEEACMVGMEEEEEEMGEDGRGRKKGRGFSGRYADRLFLVFLPPLSVTSDESVLTQLGRAFNCPGACIPRLLRACMVPLSSMVVRPMLHCLLQDLFWF